MFSAFMFYFSQKTHPQLVDVTDTWRNAVVLRREVIDWLNANVPNRYSYTPGELQAAVLLKNKEDAALFKMMWL